MQRLEQLYADYLDCLNRQDWENLGRFVSEDAKHNGRAFGLAGYRAMLEADFRAIPDLRFDAELVVASPTHVASRLIFDCRPTGEFLGLAVNGRRVRFAEHVFYRFENGRIAEVWSMIDKAEIAKQLSGSNSA